MSPSLGKMFTFMVFRVLENAVKNLNLDTLFMPPSPPSKCSCPPLQEFICVISNGNPKSHIPFGFLQIACSHFFNIKDMMGARINKDICLFQRILNKIITFGTFLLPRKHVLEASFSAFLYMIKA